MIINYKEAYDLARLKQDESNLARSYLSTIHILHTVWHCMNSDNPPLFPMDRIEEVLKGLTEEELEVVR